MLIRLLIEGNLGETGYLSTKRTLSTQCTLVVLYVKIDICSDRGGYSNGRYVFTRCINNGINPMIFSGSPFSYFFITGTSLYLNLLYKSSHANDEQVVW